MKLNMRYKRTKLKNNIQGKLEILQLWILRHLSQDIITEYAIDHELCHDYYNEPPEHG